MIARDFLYVSCKCPEHNEAEYKVPVKKRERKCSFFIYFYNAYFNKCSVFSFKPYVLHTSVQYPSHVTWEWCSFFVLS